MREDEARAVMERALGPLLREAGFVREGDRWTSRVGDFLRTVEVAFDEFDRATVRASTVFVPALDVLRSAPPELDLTCGTVPPSQLLLISVCSGMEQDQLGGGYRHHPQWEYEKLTVETLEASVIDTYRNYIARFFERTSTLEGAFMEVYSEGKYGDCGPMSWFECEVNHFVAVAFFLTQDERWRAYDMVHEKLEKAPPGQPWAAFKKWALKEER